MEQRSHRFHSSHKAPAGLMGPNFQNTSRQGVRHHSPPPGAVVSFIYPLVSLTGPPPFCRSS